MRNKIVNILPKISLWNGTDNVQYMYGLYMSGFHRIGFHRTRVTNT